MEDFIIWIFLSIITAIWWFVVIGIKVFLLNTRYFRFSNISWVIGFLMPIIVVVLFKK